MIDRPERTPPRSETLLRAKLASISSSPTEAALGDLTKRRGHRVLLTNFRSLENCRAFQAQLGAQQIHTSRVRRRNRYELSVDEEDRKTAAELLDAYRVVNPDVPDPNAFRRFDATIFLTAIFGGVAFAFAFATTRLDATAGLFIPVQFAAIGGMLGFLFDQRRRIKRFGLTDLFLFLAIVALLLSLSISWLRFMRAPV